MMNVDAASAVMARGQHRNRVLVAMLIYTAALSAVLTYLDAHRIREPQWLQVSTTLLFSFLIFGWYWLDSDARTYRRSAWLSIAVVAIAPVAIPYYLIRSRATGERARALGGLAGFVGLLVLAIIIGGEIGALVS